VLGRGIGVGHLAGSGHRAVIVRGRDVVAGSGSVNFARGG